MNNAGFVLGVDKVGNIDDNEVDAMVATNVIGLISVTQLLVKGERFCLAFRSDTPSSVPLDFKARGTGHVINLGSVAGREPYAGGSIYCATKHAVRAFSGALMRELVDTPIRVTEIQPGMVETEFSNTRYRGDKAAAKNAYKGLEPCRSTQCILLHDVHSSLHSGSGGYR